MVAAISAHAGLILRIVVNFRTLSIIKAERLTRVENGFFEASLNEMPVPGLEPHHSATTKRPSILPSQIDILIARRS